MDEEDVYSPKVGNLENYRATHADILHLWQREFDEEYLPAYSGNDHLAYKKYSNALHSAANAMTEDLFMRRRNKNNKDMRKQLTKHATYEKLSAFVDDKIEADIRFFSKGYSRKQRYIINIRKQIRRNQKIVHEREMEAAEKYKLSTLHQIDEQKDERNYEDFSDTEENHVQDLEVPTIDRLGRAQKRQKTNEQYFGHAGLSAMSTTHKNRHDQS